MSHRSSLRANPPVLSNFTFSNPSSPLQLGSSREQSAHSKSELKRIRWNEYLHPEVWRGRGQSVVIRTWQDVWLWEKDGRAVVIAGKLTKASSFRKLGQGLPLLILSSHLMPVRSQRARSPCDLDSRGWEQIWKGKRRLTKRGYSSLSFCSVWLFISNNEQHMYIFSAGLLILLNTWPVVGLPIQSVWEVLNVYRCYQITCLKYCSNFTNTIYTPSLEVDVINVLKCVDQIGTNYYVLLYFAFPRWWIWKQESWF